WWAVGAFTPRRLVNALPCPKHFRAFLAAGFEMIPHGIFFYLPYYVAGEISPLSQREMSHSIPPKFYFLTQPTEKARQVRLHHLSIRVRRRRKNIGAVEIPKLSGVDLADECKWSPMIRMRMGAAQFVHRTLQGGGFASPFLDALIEGGHEISGAAVVDVPERQQKRACPCGQ